MSDMPTPTPIDVTLTCILTPPMQMCTCRDLWKTLPFVDCICRYFSLEYRLYVFACTIHHYNKVTTTYNI